MNDNISEDEAMNGIEFPPSPRFSDQEIHDRIEIRTIPWAAHNQPRLLDAPLRQLNNFKPYLTAIAIQEIQLKIEKFD